MTQKSDTARVSFTMKVTPETRRALKRLAVDCDTHPGRIVEAMARPEHEATVREWLEDAEKGT